MGAQHNQELAYADFKKHFGDLSAGGVGALGLVEYLSEEVKQKMISFGATLQVTFAGFDVNNDGTLARREFEDGLRKLGVPMSAREVDECFRVLDLSGNGKLNYKEFTALFSRKKLKLHYLTTEVRRSLALARVNLRQVCVTSLSLSLSLSLYLSLSLTTCGRPSRCLTATTQVRLTSTFSLATHFLVQI